MKGSTYRASIVYETCSLCGAERHNAVCCMQTSHYINGSVFSWDYVLSGNDWLSAPYVLYDQWVLK